MVSLRIHKQQHVNDPCAYCDERFELMSWDHVVPLSRGGRDVATNVVRCCRPCNATKADRLLAELPECWWELPPRESRHSRTPEARRARNVKRRARRRAARSIDFTLRPGDGFGADY